MTYEQFVESQILFHERVLADIRAGRVSWCEDCETWVPAEEMRADPWGGDWRMCIDCIADQGLDDSPVSEDEYEEHLADSAMEAAERTTDEEAEQC
jgi:hypothetical protein